MTLNKRICLKIAEAINEHDQEVDHDDVVGCLLTTAAAFSKPRLGVERTLIQLAIQMVIVADYDMEKTRKAITQVIAKNEHLKVDPEFKKRIEESITGKHETN